MSLNVEINVYDYKSAIDKVQKLLDKIEAIPGDEDVASLDGMPSAQEIVDTVWDEIK